jgi:carbon storage regulator CsrA
MLVLTRKPNQSIYLLEDQLGLNLKVTFLRKDSSNQIKLGFEAPENFKIFREELLTSKLRSEFQLKKGGDHHPYQIHQPLRQGDKSFIKVCS